MNKFFEVVIIWETGEKEVYAYKTEEEARTTEKELKKIFGNQISWIYTRKK